jgi:uncharacterized protein YfeS
MIKFTNYFYYSKNDSKKEAIDKVSTSSLENAINYFSQRKKIDIETFNKLYTVEEYAGTQSK